MDFAQLAAHVGETFTLAGASVTLASATPAGAGGSLIFAGAPESPLEQGTYDLAHPLLGDDVLFVVPVAAGTYQAIFN